MSQTIDTKNVAGRRVLHFENFDAIAAELDRLAQASSLKSLGNWSPGQIFEHLAIVMRQSIDGGPAVVPWYIRLFFRWFVKKKALRETMKAGFQLPEAAKHLIPAPIDDQNGLKNLKSALARLRKDPTRAPNIVFGPLTNEEWEKLHCRHCELHLSFVVPG